MVEDESCLRAGSHEFEGDRELPLENAEIESEFEPAKSVHIFAEAGGLGEFVGLGVEDAANAGQARMGDRLEAPLEIRRLGPGRCHNGLDERAGLFCKGAKIAGLVVGFFAIDLHKNPSLDSGVARGVLVIREIESSREGGETLCPLVGEAVWLEEVDMRVDHDDFRWEVSWVQARSRCT